ncbi:MAG: 5-(carboxyamino)imidazole ribonucleotide mutase [bacterium]|nr:5-(carboxyamino)imidazole ribonucleotide mutase [bacterium]MDT8365205.1 5-(carboxyamino)imidazole ribonucleotide mutase [bacterium]
MEKVDVLILMGSPSDESTMVDAANTLRKFGVPFRMAVASAHRTPERVRKLVEEAEKDGCSIFIAGAGWAAHLAGVVASLTVKPVIGVPIPSSPLNGLDSLLSTVQMPGGIPVATVALGNGGAQNAALLAISILALSDDSLSTKLEDYRKELAEAFN